GGICCSSNSTSLPQPRPPPCPKPRAPPRRPPANRPTRLRASVLLANVRQRRPPGAPRRPASLDPLLSIARPASARRFTVSSSLMLNVVILAAGLGKRMQSDLPKVLHSLAGKPMLEHVLDSARQLEPGRIVVVVGHGAERVRGAYEGRPGLCFALQQPQQGTGHAVQQAVPLLQEDGQDDVTLVLYGDVPLVQPDTLRRLLQARAQGAAVLTEVLDDATGYGRIVRNEQGQVARIVEHKDATEAERAIREVNTGIMAAPTARLKEWLGRIDNNNAQGEYYLTDVIGLAVADGVAVGAAQPSAGWETLGVNSRVQQAELERRWQLEQARRQLEAGVTLADPARFDVRGALSCG